MFSVDTHRLVHTVFPARPCAQLPYVGCVRHLEALNQCIRNIPGTNLLIRRSRLVYCKSFAGGTATACRSLCLTSGAKAAKYLRDCLQQSMRNVLSLVLYPGRHWRTVLVTFADAILKYSDLLMQLPDVLICAIHLDFESHYCVSAWWEGFLFVV